MSRTDETVLLPTLSSLLLSTVTSLAAAASSSNQIITPSINERFLASSESTTYLASLLGQPLTTLQSLPSSLSNLSTSLDNDLASLAFTRYNSFLLSYSATTSISTSFTTLATSLDALLASTTALESSANSFQEKIHSVREKRERMVKVRERMDEVEELLEAPAVVDACVRAGYWSEAIDVALRLSSASSTMASSSSSSGTEGKGALILLTRIRKEVAVALLSLRARVLESLLQRGLKLPGAVRGIGILRRINESGSELEGSTGVERNKHLSEEALRIVFLAARWKCLRGELDGVEGQMVARGIKLGAPSTSEELMVSLEDNEERMRWIKKWVEVWREIIGETIGMYTEVFLSTSINQDQQLDNTSITALSAITLFLSTAITSLTTILATSIPFITSTSSLSSLLTQITYCSHSFARFGSEFKEFSKIQIIIEERVGKIILQDWAVAGKAFERELREGWEGKGSIARTNRKGRVTIAEWLVVPEGLSTLLATSLPTIITPWTPAPPFALSLLPPLTHLVNAHATALNSLRLLPALSLYRSLRIAHCKELDRVARVLEAFINAYLVVAPPSAPTLVEDSSPEEVIQLKMRQEERELLRFLIAAVGRWVIPWCEGALRIGVYAEMQGGGGSVEEETNDLIEKAKKRIEDLLTTLVDSEKDADDVDESIKTEIELDKGGHDAV
jgi:hypothetical protein